MILTLIPKTPETKKVRTLICKIPKIAIHIESNFRTLTELNVSDGLLDVVVDGVSGVDEETVVELHRLGTLTTELSRDDNL